MNNNLIEFLCNADYRSRFTYLGFFNNVTVDELKMLYERGGE